MNINKICILVSSLSFFAYVATYFTSSHMKDEFKRFGLENLALLTIILEFMGATGLMVGLIFKPVLTASSLGLALLMLVALIIRLKLKDSIWISSPSIFYMCLNIYIFWESIK
ncbi:MAG: DoxX family protein [Saprospiraceae bacterium]|nr:DoxX family protein [Saprospiraceae bacterium]